MRKYLISTIIALSVILLSLIGFYFLSSSDDKASNKSTQTATNKQNDNKNDSKTENSTQKAVSNTTDDNTKKSSEDNSNKTPETISSPTIINGVILANKKHPLPKNYNPGENAEARAMVNKLIRDAQSQGLNVSNQVSGFRSYQTQLGLYNNYVASHGKTEADTFSARPGYSEHQTGLVFDLIDNEGQLLGSSTSNASSKQAASWLEKNCYKYGFIVRYKPEFVNKTGYMEESWHIRYVGNDIAKELYEKNIPLEDYLNAEGGNYVGE